MLAHPIIDPGAIDQGLKNCADHRLFQWFCSHTSSQQSRNGLAGCRVVEVVADAPLPAFHLSCVGIPPHGMPSVLAVQDVTQDVRTVLVLVLTLFPSKLPPPH